MGSGTLTDRSTGQTILEEFFNDIHGALEGDFVGRNVSGVATSGQNLGTSAIPWGTIRADSVVLGGVAVDTSQITSVVNRIISGKTRSTSNQGAFITPNGSAASFILYGATTNLVVDINGSEVTVNTDITKSSLSTAPSSNNTCLVNDSTASGQDDTRNWGEFGMVGYYKNITVDAMGSSITALVGTFQAFKVVDSGNTEYFWAYVSSSTQLSKCFRGYFYDSSLAPVNRTVLTDNDVITLMKTGWVFIQNDSTTVDVSYTNPVYDFVAPSSPATGDYWYDLGNSLWKRYDGATFQVINRTLIAMVVMDSTNCKAARCLPFYANWKSINNIGLEIFSNSVIEAASPYARCNTQGVDFNFGNSLPQWNSSTMLASAADLYNASLQANTTYYLYVKDTGATVISDIAPYYRRDLLARYHPHNPWLCIGMGVTDGSTNWSATYGFREELFPDVKSSYTPTISGVGTATNVVFEYRRNKRFLEVYGTFTTGTVSGTQSISLPGDLRIGTMSINNSTAQDGPRVGLIMQSHQASFAPIITATATSTSVVYFGDYIGDTSNSILNANNILSSNSVTAVEFRIPISGWTD